MACVAVHAKRVLTDLSESDLGSGHSTGRIIWQHTQRAKAPPFCLVQA